MKTLTRYLPILCILVVISSSLLFAHTRGPEIRKSATSTQASSTTFIALTDTPGTYVGEATNCTKVNAGETAIEFGDCGSAIAVDLSNNASDDIIALTRINTANDTNSIVTENVTDEILIDMAQNWPSADTADALSANGGNCSASNAPLGVDASGAVEDCTDFEEELNNSAGLLAAVSDATGTGLAVFGTSPTIATPVFTLATTSDVAVGRMSYNTSSDNIEVGDGVAVDVFVPGAHTTDTNAGTVCSGTTTYLDGEGSCDDIAPTYANVTGDTYSNGHNFGGAEIEITNGVSVTTDLAGEIGIDTTSDQLRYFGMGQVNIPSNDQFDVTLESPDDADAFLVYQARQAITITDIECVVDPAGSGETVVIDIQECDGNGDSCTTVDATITCANTTTSDDGSLTNPSIDSDDYINLDIGAVTGTVTQLKVRVKFTYDAT